MTDRESLYFYRLGQAEETLSEAEKMLQEISVPDPSQIGHTIQCFTLYWLSF